MLKEVKVRLTEEEITMLKRISASESRSVSGQVSHWVREIIAQRNDIQAGKTQITPELAERYR